MGWAKNDDGLRLYYERAKKVYLLVDVKTQKDRLEAASFGGDGSYEYIGEMYTENDPEKPCLASGSVGPDFLYRKCRRVAWSSIPAVWQEAFRPYITGSIKRHRGLERILSPVEIEIKKARYCPRKDLPMLMVTLKYDSALEVIARRLQR